MNDGIGIYLKYASEPQGSYREYGFAFTQDQKDDLKRLRNETEAALRALDEECVQAVSDAVAFADDSPFPEPEELMTDVYVRYG